MRANKFIKEFGWELAKRDVAAIESGFIEREYFIEHYGFDILDDLKRLVESHELVQVGLPELKKAMFSDSKDLEYVKNWLLTVSEKFLTEKGIKLKQAIADVESCL